MKNYFFITFFFNIFELRSMFFFFDLKVKATPSMTTPSSSTYKKKGSQFEVNPES